MAEHSLHDRLTSFRNWRQMRVRLLHRLQVWLRQQGLHTAEARHAIDRARHALQDARLTLVVTGGAGRGKTELVNALLSVDRGRRLLPVGSGAGPTGPCPTEIRFDPAASPQLRLLPTESRRDDRSLASLRDAADEWCLFDLDPDDPEGVPAQLQRLSDRQPLAADEATAAGLPGGAHAASCESAAVPRWRLALLNLPHPLLAEGLRVLDTSGLDAAGSEPELVYGMLPTAQAIVFVLAADTGVGRSDLQLWQHYIERQGRAGTKRVVVVLNKTDLLWDAQRSSAETVERIVHQCREVAQTLGVDESQVFAISAQQALRARRSGDTALARRSGIVGLETRLGDMLATNRIAALRHEHTLPVQQAIEALQIRIERRLERIGQQRLGLADLAEKSDAAIARRLALTRQDRDRYQYHLQTYRRHLVRFERHRRRLLDAVDAARFDEVLEEIRRTMTGAWTTHGLKDAMRALFDEVDARIDSAGAHARAMQRLVRTMHRQFHEDDRFHVPPPRMFSMARQQTELSLLAQDAETFRNSVRTTLMEQHFVSKRYHSTIAVRARAIVRQVRDEAANWAAHALAPLAHEIKDHRETLAQQIDDLEQAGESRKTIQQRLESLARDVARLRAQATALAKIQDRFDEQPSPPPACRPPDATHRGACAVR